MANIRIDAPAFFESKYIYTYKSDNIFHSLISLDSQNKSVCNFFFSLNLNTKYIVKGAFFLQIITINKIKVKLQKS